MGRAASAHTWVFRRRGGSDQVAIGSADDLRNLRHLDQKLWAALACPVHGNALDAATLALVDTDGDGRIRAPELLEAIAWCDRVLVDLTAVLEGTDGLVLDNLADHTMQASAQRILDGRGIGDALEITVADTRAANEVLDAMAFNGDGVVPPAMIEGDLQQVVVDLLGTVGGVPDRTGQLGADAPSVERFFTELAAYAGWKQRAEEDENTVVPLGPDTADAVEAFAAVREKVEDYFTRCAVAAFDPRAAAHLGGSAEVWEAMTQRELQRDDTQIASFPLAEVGVERPLPLTAGLNPAWAEAIARLRTDSVVPLLGERDALTQAEWRDLCRRFVAYEAWLASKEGPAVESLGIDRVRELLAGDHRSALEALIARDEAIRPEAEALGAVERAARYQRDLAELVRNFVSLSRFYNRDATAMFQAGTLFLDGRSCELVVEVADVAAHASLAAPSFLYLAYCRCTRKGAAKPIHIAAAFTDGDDDFLTVGRNGVLYDRDGNDWDATILKVVEQPISIRQAFWAPYKRLGRFVSNQIEKITAEMDKTSQAHLESSATAATTGATTATDAAGVGPKAFDIGKYAGIFAAIGLGAGFLVSALTMLLTAFLALRPWQMPLAVIALLMLVSGPSMLLAAFKLSRRNLAPVLDANGWAINARARINIPFGRSLTHVAALPDRSRRDLGDPYGDGRTVWWLLALLLLVLAVVAVLWDLGLSAWLQTLLPQPVPPDPG